MLSDAQTHSPDVVPTAPAYTDAAFPDDQKPRWVASKSRPRRRDFNGTGDFEATCHKRDFEATCQSLVHARAKHTSRRTLSRDLHGDGNWPRFGGANSDHKTEVK